MNEILSKLHEMGITATEKQIKNWLKAKSIALDAVTDSHIIDMAGDFGAAVVPAESPADLAAVPKGWDKIEADDAGGNIPSSRLEDVRLLGEEEGREDAALLFSEYETSYTKAFSGEVARRSGFRQRLKDSAIELLRRA